MKEADVKEVWASSRKTPFEALQESVMVSRDAKAGLINEKTVCIFGIGSVYLLGNTGIPWALTSVIEKRYIYLFMKVSKVYIDYWKEQYSLLTNVVDSRNIEAIKFIRWLGFDIKPAVPFGPDKVPFHSFEMIN